MKAKQRLIDINTKLQAVHAAAAAKGVSLPELDELHASMKHGLDEQHRTLGLSDEDRLEVYSSGTAARGGTPKDGDPA